MLASLIGGLMDAVPWTAWRLGFSVAASRFRLAVALPPCKAKPPQSLNFQMRVSMATTSLMRQETMEASSVVSRLLSAEAATIDEIKRIFRQRAPRVLTTAARGSSDHAASFFKYLFEISVGLPVASIGPSVTSVYNARLQLQDGLHFTVSQSGASPDIVALQKAAKQGGAVTVAVVNVIDSPLANDADIVLNLNAGKEQSVAATKSCIAAAAALAAVTAAITEDQSLDRALARLPEALELTTHSTIDPAVISRLAAINEIYAVGRGTGFAVALEAALKDLRHPCRSILAR